MDLARRDFVCILSSVVRGLTTKSASGWGGVIVSLSTEASIRTTLMVMRKRGGRLALSKYSDTPFGESRRTTARKQHICTSCGAEIGVGETYFREEQFLKNLGRPTVGVCETCHNEGRFDLRFLESKQREEPRTGPIDRYI